MRIVTSSEMKQIEQAANERGLSYRSMMENAGVAAAQSVLQHGAGADLRVLVFAGKGNNGGDGFVAARHLHDAGARVKVVLVEGQPKTGDAAENLQLLRELGIEILDLTQQEEKICTLLARAQVVIDAIYGTGFHGELREAAKKATGMISSASAQVLALDMPSGINADNGELDENAVCADSTAVFDSFQPAHFIYPALEHCGVLECVDIGIVPACRAGVQQGFTHITDQLVFAAIAPRGKNSHKGTFGKLLNIASSRGMTGAARLSVLGALRVGTGLVTLGAPASLLAVHEVALTEAVFLPLAENAAGSVAAACTAELGTRLCEMTACLVGCGMAHNDDTAAVVEYVLTHAKCPVLVDADGINALCRNINRVSQATAPVVLTPHSAEMARLLHISTAELLAHKVELCKAFVAKHRVTLVMKGANTLIFVPEGEVLVNTTGNSGLAKGGSGDILAGMIAGFLAQGMSARDSAMCGVYLHGKAADRCAARLSRTAMLPSDIFTDLCALFLEHDR